jgi:hypothetical protein
MTPELIGIPIRATGNPGGAGHSWVKARYVSPAPLGNKVIVDPDTGLKRIFIPSKVADNRFIDQAQYVAQLRMSGSEQLVRAWLDGDWSAIESGFFANEWSDRVIIPPFTVPPHWTRLRAMDWGFSTPFAVYWAAVASDDYIDPDLERSISPDLGRSADRNASKSGASSRVVRWWSTASGTARHQASYPPACA